MFYEIDSHNEDNVFTNFWLLFFIYICYATVLL